MALLLDIFGYLSVVIHGLTILAQSMALGGVLFLVFLARRFEIELGDTGMMIRDRTRALAFWSAIGLVICESATILLQGAVLVGTVNISWLNVLQAEFALASLIKIAGAVLIAASLYSRRDGAPSALLLATTVIVLCAATLMTHANARLQDRVPLMIVEGLHQLGAAIWVGGIPSFLIALARCHDGAQWRRVGKRFSQMSMIGVACIVVSGSVMSLLYIGSLQGFYGTAYGVMVSTKIVMFSALLCLGAGNYLLIERLQRDPATPVKRLKRFAEIELAIGVAIFFAAASVTSSPPAVDLTDDRVTWAEILTRNAPVWPRMVSPSHDDLAIPALQAQFDAEAAQQATKPQPAFVAGSGIIPPRNAEDIAWSEYNHHWAGVFVVVIGFFALLAQAGLRIFRHWPLVFLGLAAFLFLRSDPEVWPLGQEGLLESLRDPEVVQHRFFVLLTIMFAIFEWRVRAGTWANTKAALVFPVMTAFGGALLLTHQHAIANVKDQLLIELTHTPLALAGIAAGCTRWLELRLDPPGSKVVGWIWPVCLILVGIILLSYREA